MLRSLLLVLCSLLCCGLAFYSMYFALQNPQKEVGWIRAVAMLAGVSFAFIGLLFTGAR